MNKSIFRFITLLGFVVMIFGGAGSMAAQSESGSCPWNELTVWEVSDADGLSRALCLGGTDNFSIKLTGDITVKDLIYCLNNSTIDLNGKTIDISGSTSSITVTTGCLNIFDSSTGGTGIVNIPVAGFGFIVSNGGTLNFYGGKISCNVSGTAVNNTGTVNVYGGTFDKNANAINNIGTLNIYGGTFTGERRGTGVKNTGTVTVEGGTFDGLVECILNEGTLNIKGGKFTGGGNGTGVKNDGTATVEGGQFENLVKCIDNANTLNIKGGKFIDSGIGTCVYNSRTATVDGGQFDCFLMGIDNADAGTLDINGGIFSCYNSGTAVHNSGTATVKNGEFLDPKKGIDNAGTLNIKGGVFDGIGIGTGMQNSGTVTVEGGTFKRLKMGIYNANELSIQALPTVGTGDDANATADIGLKEGKVITMAGEISSLPEDYAKIKVGQFSYSESGGYSAAGSVPYMLTSGYKDKVKGIHPAMMFQAYDDVPADYENYEVCAKSGSGTDVGEAQVVKVGEYAAAIFTDGNQGLTADLQICVDYFPENTPNAEIKLLRNVDLGSGFVTVDNGSAANPVVIDLNGHLLTSSHEMCVIWVNSGTGLTIRDSGSGGAIVSTNTDGSNGISNKGGTITVEGGSISATGEAIANTSGTLTVTGGTFTGGGKGIENDGGTLTVEGGSISATGYAISNTSGTLTVTGGTFTGGENAVYNGSQDAATISGGTLIGAAGENPAIDNDGTMELGCGSGAVTVLGGGGSSAVGNRDALTVGENVTIMSGTREGIYNAGTLTVKGFPTFDAGNACDIILEQASDNTNTLISFNADISGVPANPIKIKIEDGYGNAVTPGTSGLTLTSGYAAHVKRGGEGADKDRPRDPGEVFTVLGVADGAGVGLKGGEAVAFAECVPVAEVKSGDDTYTYNIGTGALGFSTAAEALREALKEANAAPIDVTVKMLSDVDLDTEYLTFRNTNDVDVNGVTRKVNMTLDLNGCELSSRGSTVIRNQASSLTLEDTKGGGKILQYSANGTCIGNEGGLTVKDVTLSVSGSSGYGIDNHGTLTIDGEMKFLGSEGVVDVVLYQGYTIGIGENLKLTAKLKTYVVGLGTNPRKLTTDYGKNMRYPAEHANAGKVKAPGDVFTVSNIGSRKLAFAGGEAWVVPSGTLALIQTGTTVNAYTDVATLASDLVVLDENATVMLADDVNMGDYRLWFKAPGQQFTFDLGGHEISGASPEYVTVGGGALLDITDSGVGGRIKITSNFSAAISNIRSTLSIQGGVTIESTGNLSYCLWLNGGTTTFNGWPMFVPGENPSSDIYLNQNDVITFTDDIIGAPVKKISVQIYGDNLGTFTSGYGAHVKYPAGHEKAGEPIDPEEIFTYKPQGTPVASVHAHLVGSGDAVEAAFWMPHQMVAYVDADGNLHDDLTGSTPETTDDGHDAYILDGTEKTLGMSGTDTWYVALPGVKSPGDNDFIYYDPIELKGNVHLVLADGCDMRVDKSNDRGCIYGDATTSLTVYSQSDKYDKSRLELDPYIDGAAGIRARTVNINGGLIDISGNSISDCAGIIADGGGLTVNGGLVNTFLNTGIEAIDCDLTVNGGTVLTSTVYGGDYGIMCLTNGAHTIDINGGKVSAYGNVAGIWATNSVNIKSDVTAVCTGEYGYGIYSNEGDINISGGKVAVDADNIGNHGIRALDGSVSITAGQVEVIGYSNGIYAENGILLSLSESSDYIKSNGYLVISGGVKIPAGQYLGASDDEDISYLVFGSADADYVFGVGDNAALNDIDAVTLVKATSIAGSGNYLAYDSSDGDWLLGSGTEALYPTGLKFTKVGEDQYTAEILLTNKPLAGVPLGKPLILAKKSGGDGAWIINLIGTNDNADEGKTPDDIENDYNGRTDILANFIATDGAKTLLQLMSAATGETVSTADDARDYLVFTLTGDRFVPVMFTGAETPAAGKCLLVIPKLNILLHKDLGTGANDSSSGARAISLGGSEGSDTGVKEVIGDSEIQDDTYFGLDGRKLNTAPTQKGIYIRNGKKIVIR